MALNNIHKEPKREIIESFVGLGLAFPAFTLIYLMGNYIAHASFDPDLKGHIFRLIFSDILGMLASTLGLFLAFLLIRIVLEVVHGLGETVCAFLKGIGHEIRPTERYDSTWLARRRAIKAGLPIPEEQKKIDRIKYLANRYEQHGDTTYLLLAIENEGLGDYKKYLPEPGKVDASKPRVRLSGYESISS